MNNPWFKRLSLFAVFLALVVVVLGAYVRLSDAGLGCPDWPGCYGQIAVPEDTDEVAAANAAYPDRPVEAHKAWKEMVHRYLAGTLGLVILVLALLALRNRIDPEQPVGLPLFLVILVVFQALLGMWTVTLLLKPLIVMGHLLGGLTVLGLLWWMYLRYSGAAGSHVEGSGLLRFLAMAGLVVLVAQIALGGWTSSNYAALACTDFPACYENQWWPPMDFKEAFIPWRGLGTNYEYGVLDQPARVAIHVSHRIGFVVTALVLALTGLVALFAWQPLVKVTGILMLLVLGAQAALGIGNVVLGLPLPVAVAHNGVASLLLLMVILLNHQIRPRSVRII